MYVYTNHRNKSRASEMEGREDLVQQIECLSFSCPLDYCTDIGHKDLHPAVLPQANPYSWLGSSLNGRKSESGTVIRMQRVPAAIEMP
jgi:hypothetical protein